MKIWALGRIAFTASLLCAANAVAQERVTVLAGPGHTVIGRAELDQRGMIRILDAAPRRAAWLRDVAARMNAKRVLHVEAPPPAGAPRYTSASRLVGRDEPGFIPALRDYLRQYYKVELAPG